MKRHLSRMLEKHRTVEQKYKDLRDEKERLQVQLSESPTITENLHFHSKHSQIRSGQKKVNTHHSQNFFPRMLSIKRHTSIYFQQYFGSIHIHTRFSGSTTRVDP